MLLAWTQLQEAETRKRAAEFIVSSVSGAEDCSDMAWHGMDQCPISKIADLKWTGRSSPGWHDGIFQ